MGWVIAGIVAIAVFVFLKRTPSADKKNPVAGRVERNRALSAKRAPLGQTKAKAKAAGSASARPSGPYAAASVKPGMTGACEPALKNEKKRYLLKDAPGLPLPGCDYPQCACKLVYHEDRRSDDDDRRIGIGLQTQLYGTSGEDDRRGRRRGRRSTDI